MPRDSITAFVAGATGYQGGATARQLLNAGVQVHALVRDTSSKAAIDLQAQGAQLFLGDFDNTTSLKAAISGASAIFLNVTPDPLDSGLEVKRAKNIIDAAKESGSVSTMIYSSVAMTGKHETFPNWGPEYPLAWYWTNKSQIEMMVRNAEFQYWTILRPAFLMNNYHQPKASSMFPELVTNCVFLTAYNPNTRMTMVDPGDVGKFAAAAVLEPLRFNRCEIDLGAESLKPADIVRGLSLASGKEIALEFYSRDEAERRAASDPRLWAQLWANEVGYQVNFKALEKYKIEMTSFSKYLEEHRDAVLQTFV
ncbi:nmrA-like family domain-containing protein DDB_G0286605 [Aspergillus udagawae]|uniref:NmrA-like family domain-containing protein DDB_G0286605 n=1 Tax=Aspergillus udagawae TaxID=91492 RepID=A0A8H3NFK1_9EURO|nr:nmrA-like family domain-containing protein DDB_G0286605 [Aspergillus udagawae]